MLICPGTRATGIRASTMGRGLICSRVGPGMRETGWLESIMALGSLSGQTAVFIGGSGRTVENMDMANSLE